MKIHPLNTSIATLFLAPDIDPAGGGGESAAVVPISNDLSPTGAPIPAAPVKEAQPATVLQPKVVEKQRGVIDVKKALGLKESPKDENNREAKEILKKAAGDTVIPIPKPKKKAEAAAAAPVDDAAAKVEAEAKAAADKKAADDDAAAAAQPTKIKIGGQEKTEAEWEAHFKALEEKKAAAAAGDVPPIPKMDQKKEPELTPEARAAEEKRKDDEFLAKHVKTINIPQERFDKIIADGDVQELSRLFAERELAIFKHFENLVNPVLADLANSVEPALQMHREVAQYRAEADFYNDPANADLAGHKKTVRMINQTLQSKYPTEFAAMSAADRAKEIATHSRSFIKEFNIQPEQVKAPAPSPNATPAPAAAAKPPTPKPAQPKPPTGNLGGSGAPANVSPQKSLIAQLEASGK